jgi:spore germination cell wall hydrolase CwlJ-like protein
MRNNKAILDEAARSIRRTFIGSVTGSLGMMVVVGAAGAYGMPERLTAHALSAAVAKFNVAFPHAAELARRDDSAAKVAASDAPPATAFQAIYPVRDVVMPAANESIVKTVPPEAPTAPLAAPPAEPAPASAPRETIVASIAPAEPAPSLVQPLAPEPAPAVTSSAMPQAQPDAPRQRAADPASMMFGAPKLSDIKPLEAMPKLEMIDRPQEPKPLASAEPQTTKSAETAVAMLTPAETASAPAEQPVVQFPALAILPMPLAKPPLTPAQRLDLSAKNYDKAQHCLAQAVYFEARNEPARGQMAVAQVVLNRVFSPYYPKDVCSVVYQNAHHFLGCQFTFACDGKPESIREFGAWARANRIAHEALDAKIWLPDVAKATHYHASYVRPGWIRDMRVMVRYGLHTFYRPRNWGDGSNEPAWGAGAKKSAKS